MKKILILNYEFPPLGGGAGNATQNISKELVRLGHDVTVVTTWFQNLKDEEVVDGYKLIRLHSKRERKDRSNTFEMFHYVLKAIFYCKKLVMDEKPDFIISFFALPTGLIAWYLKKKFNIPYTLSLRGGDVPSFLPKNLKRLHFITMPITYLVWKSAHSIVANSEGLKNLARNTANKINKKVLCIPNGVDTDLFKPNSDKYSNDNKPGKFKILFVGRLTEQKGVIHILESLAEIKVNNPTTFQNIICEIIGDGPLRESLEKQSKAMMIQDHVKFLGWIDRNVLPRKYQESSVFVLPTIEEGMPNVVLEAMSCGLPVITTDVIGNNEIIESEKNGLLIKNVSDLATAIIRLFNDKELAKKISEESRKSSLERSWKGISEAYARLSI